MSSHFDRATPHPVLGCIERLDTALEETLDVPVLFLAPTEKREALRDLTRVEAQLSALKLRLMACSDDVALSEGARDIAALLTHDTRTDAGTNRGDLALAEALDRRWLQVATALGQGEVNVAQALVITRALDALPADRVPAGGAHRGRGEAGHLRGRVRAT